MWDYQSGDFFYDSPAIADGMVYVDSFDHKMYCLLTVTAEVPESQTARSQNGTILLFFIRL
ncbi:MAG TPA: PQQ-binding-like beta-propeller repeat protein [Candidatus Thermoplasmatota archaeon]|nr:PQQ-binding-like beta-propeller repeat protein [Candidatus Thermoplasmatota archaeon]